MSFNNTTIVFNEWDKGSNHYVFWSIYTILNYTGVVLCTAVMSAIVKLGLKNRENWKSNDVFVLFLCLGCFCMSAACATQCFLNMIDGKGYFSWGETACVMEAFWHVSSIMLQFFFHYINCGKRLYIGCQEHCTIGIQGTHHWMRYFDTLLGRNN